jgi:hypothetical protein
VVEAISQQPGQLSGTPAYVLHLDDSGITVRSVSFDVPA